MKYGRIKKRLEEGANPIDIGSNTLAVAKDKVLIKGAHGRYLVQVSGNQVNVLGICSRGNKKNVKSFKRLNLVEVATPRFLSTLMEKVESDFVPAGYPYIIVSKLTDEIIRAAIQEFIDAKEDSYWLKLYHITATLNIEDINEILDRKEKEDIELELEAKINVEIEGE